MFLKKGITKAFYFMILTVLFSLPCEAVELKLFINEPQGSRCKENIKTAMEALKEVSNVKVCVISKYMSKQNDPDAPAVMINDKVLSEDRGVNN